MRLSSLESSVTPRCPSRASPAQKKLDRPTLTGVLIVLAWQGLAASVQACQLHHSQHEHFLRKCWFPVRAPQGQSGTLAYRPSAVVSFQRLAEPEVIFGMRRANGAARDVGLME